MFLPEVMLWQRLKGSPDDVRFCRQHPLGPYVLDFFCARRGVAFEIDGQAHDRGDRPARDGARDDWLTDQGIVVQRIAASEVLADPDCVAESILRICKG